MAGDGKGYLSVRVQVGWGDCDPAGIVFYPRYSAWMDNVSHVLAREMGIPRDQNKRGQEVCQRPIRPVGGTSRRGIRVDGQRPSAGCRGSIAYPRSRCPSF